MVLYTVVQQQNTRSKCRQESIFGYQRYFSRQILLKLTKSCKLSNVSQNWAMSKSGILNSKDGKSTIPIFVSNSVITVLFVFQFFVWKRHGNHFKFFPLYIYRMFYTRPHSDYSDNPVLFHVHSTEVLQENRTKRIRQTRA